MKVTKIINENPKDQMELEHAGNNMATTFDGEDVHVEVSN